MVDMFMGINIRYEKILLSAGPNLVPLELYIFKITIGYQSEDVDTKTDQLCNNL